MKEKLGLEKEIRDSILVQHKDLVCVEFYNVKGLDPFKIKFNKLIKKRPPNSVVFYHCPKEIIENFMTEIASKIAKEVMYFFKSHKLIGLKIPKAKEIQSVKEVAMYLMATN